MKRPRPGSGHSRPGLPRPWPRVTHSGSRALAPTPHMRRSRPGSSHMRPRGDLPRAGVVGPGLECGTRGVECLGPGLECLTQGHVCVGRGHECSIRGQVCGRSGLVRNGRGVRERPQVEVENGISAVRHTGRSRRPSNRFTPHAVSAGRLERGAAAAWSYPPSVDGSGLGRARRGMALLVGERRDPTTVVRRVARDSARGG